MNEAIKKNSIMDNILSIGTVLIIGFILLLTIILRNNWYSYLMIAVCVLTVIICKNKVVKTLQYAVICITCIIITVMVMIFGRSDLSISFAGNLVNNVVREANHIYYRIIGEGFFYSILTKQSEPYKFGSWDIPKGYENKKIELSSSKGYFLYKKDSTHKKLIYQLHGGAYVVGFTNAYHDTALQYSKCYDNADVFSLDYRTAPNNLFPDALDDAVDGYKWLLEKGYQPENIIVCGDSAGGGLALSLSFYLRDNNIALPKMLILSSPWTDLCADGESYQTKILEDPFFGYPTAKASPRYPVPILYAGKTDLRNPYLSPAYGDYKKMPPILIQTGSNEILLSDSMAVAKKAKEAGVEVSFKEYNGMFHNFYVVTPKLKESRKAWTEIEEFIIKNK